MLIYLYFDVQHDQVCLNKLDDFQLAMVIVRLYESDLEESMPSSFKLLLYEQCLGLDDNGAGYNPDRASPDPFVRSMAYWILKDYTSALGTLLETDVGEERRQEAAQTAQADHYTSNPSVFNFYNYLRTHPLLVRQHLAATAADKSQTVLLSGFSYGATASAAGDKNVTYIDRITPIERRLYFTTAHEHFKNGCPALALEVLTKLPEVIDTEHDITKSHSADNEIVKGAGERSIGHGVNSIKGKSIANQSANNSFDWGQSSNALTTGTVDAFDWSQPVLRFNDDDDKDLFHVSSVESSSDESDSEPKESKSAAAGDQLCINRIVSDDVKDENKGVGDIMAHQLKFIACIKIMVDELSTLATGFEVDGGQLRYQLYIWLEKEVEVLKKLCNYCTDMDAMTYDKARGTYRSSVYFKLSIF